MSELELALSRTMQAFPASMPRRAATALAILDCLRAGSLELTLPDAQFRQLGRGACVARMHVNDWRLFDVALGKGDIGLAEAYIDGWWDTDNLPGVLTLLAKSRDVLEEAVYGNALRLLGYRLKHLLRANTREGSRRNIVAHYDLGNRFYETWLDATMSYSAALFDGDRSRSLEGAQRAKYRRILDQLDAEPGQQVLEIGCGWGGFAEIATREYGLRVLGLTISPAQLEYARQRAASRGFADLASFELRDYRDVRGRYDHIVSIEMFEAVGERFWPTYFAQLRDRLKPGGSAVVQVITIDDALFGRYRRGTDFIQRYVFPGGMLPAPAVFRRRATDCGLKVCAEFGFGHDYAHTLALWAARFEQMQAAIRAQGFREDFVRLWRFYLAYCEAGFRAGSTDVHHFTLQHAS
ncbi:MAG: class I SAM-dependent methyltransferase [Sterolibacteriaceae bacterium]|nr:class I SAM-dependent methyltransferase [Sterolibacteriaceae bacterium]MBK9087394.1 class I SAM-dependent methyltransferase [Sterolibacteriaceae bacterium]